jgi:DNA-binding transcriptional MerR regulator/quercetin dioxygenase-like cupin family protein
LTWPLEPEQYHASGIGVTRTHVYFRIGEAAHILGVSASSLRNWERMGLLTPARSQGRYRLYTRESLNNLKRIRYLRTVQRVNPAGIAAMLRPEKSRPPAISRQKKKREVIARKLARLRADSKMTLVEVARQTGVSPSFLSSLERGYANASIATLQKLARAYKTNLLSFFSDDQSSSRLVRRRERKVLEPNPGVEMELLALGNRMMEPHLFRIAPGAGSGGSYHHQGEEFIHVLEGRLEIWLDEVERYVLEAGDSLYFESTIAHRWRSLSEQQTLLLWVNTPATF